MLPSTCTASMAGSKKICFAIYWSKLIGSHQNVLEWRQMINLICAGLSWSSSSLPPNGFSSARSHLNQVRKFTVYLSNVGISKFFSLWLWFSLADEMRNGWREPSDHVYFALTLGRQQHRYEDKRHCHTLSSPLQRVPLHKGSNYSRKSSGLFSRNLKATKRLNTECCPLRNLGYRSITEHKIFHHGRGQSFIPDFSFSKSPRIWNFLPRLIHLDPLLCPWTDGGSEKGGKVAKHFITQPVQGSGVGWGSLEEEC